MTEGHFDPTAAVGVQVWNPEQRRFDTEDVAAEVYGPVAVHESIRTALKDDYTITHAATGGAFTRGMRLEDARRVARRLAADKTVLALSLDPDAMDAVRQFFTAYYTAVWAAMQVTR